MKWVELVMSDEIDERGERGKERGGRDEYSYVYELV